MPHRRHLCCSAHHGQHRSLQPVRACRPSRSPPGSKVADLRARRGVTRDRARLSPLLPWLRRTRPHKQVTRVRINTRASASTSSARVPAALLRAYRLELAQPAKVVGCGESSVAVWLVVRSRLGRGSRVGLGLGLGLGLPADVAEHSEDVLARGVQLELVARLQG